MKHELWTDGVLVESWDDGVEPPVDPADDLLLTILGA